MVIIPKWVLYFRGGLLRERPIFSPIIGKNYFFCYITTVIICFHLHQLSVKFDFPSSAVIKLAVVRCLSAVPSPLVDFGTTGALGGARRVSPGLSFTKSKIFSTNSWKPWIYYAPPPKKNLAIYCVSVFMAQNCKLQIACCYIAQDNLWGISHHSPPHAIMVIDPLPPRIYSHPHCGKFVIRGGEGSSLYDQ